MTAIEWTHRPGTRGETLNPIVAFREVNGKRLRGWHCEHASTGCINCYSERLNESAFRGGTGLPFKPGHRDDVTIELHRPTLLKPLSWKSSRTIFMCSMTDLFGSWVEQEWIDQIWAMMAMCPQHTFIVLTKRAARMRAYLSGSHRVAVARAINGFLTGEKDWRGAKAVAAIHACVPLRNVWLGISAERQEEADDRIPHLLQTPAAVRFVSAEPLLGPIDLCDVVDRSSAAPSVGEHHFSALRDPDDEADAAYLDWVIVGGESGPNARPMHPDWARSLRDQCASASVPFFFKQFGQFVPGDFHPDILTPRGQVTEFLGGLWAGRGGDGSFPLRRVGKKAAGRLLDGREHSEFPGGAHEAT